MRSLYIIMLGAMLAMAVNLMQPSDAQAMGTDCRCPAGMCSCCCCTQHEAQEPASVLQPPGDVAAGTCTCSTGPNPFSTDGTANTAYVDPPKKRLFHHSAAAASAVMCIAPAGLPDRRDKPPAVSHRSLYLLKSSFLI